MTFTEANRAMLANMLTERGPAEAGTPLSKAITAALAEIDRLQDQLAATRYTCECSPDEACQIVRDRDALHARCDALEGALRESDRIVKRMGGYFSAYHEERDKFPADIQAALKDALRRSGMGEDHPALLTPAPAAPEQPCDGLNFDTVAEHLSGVTASREVTVSIVPDQPCAACDGPDGQLAALRQQLATARELLRTVETEMSDAGCRTCGLCDTTPGMVNEGDGHIIDCYSDFHSTLAAIREYLEATK